MSDARPILGISMGDPAGIGPEIITKALAKSRVHEICRPIVVGDEQLMRNAVGFARVPLAVRAVRNVADAKFDRATIDVFQLDDIRLNDVNLGEVSPAAGHAAFEAVRVVIDLAMKGDINATVTAPIHKEALARAGHHFPGHTGDLRALHEDQRLLDDACRGRFPRRARLDARLAAQSVRPRDARPRAQGDRAGARRLPAAWHRQP
jgi:4-hydroxy-L-threonine phosphate dehydrogenase PdxA